MTNSTDKASNNAAIISVENLGKSYSISHQEGPVRNASLRDAMAREVKSWLKAAKGIAGGTIPSSRRTSEEFWALNSVSFDVNEGEVLGIIGRNGAGKSTLLKILSRITEPTRGRVTLRGRVASLLEVGTGFHGDLSGRENIFLNGAILGMTRNEIKSKFDEIVQFAGVEQFLDTPVKRYSSGMYVRLAFAVAAHLEPEILVVDEVLAVGDIEFQKKCLGKMKDVAAGGRTVLFVSHNMAAVRALCTRSILLQKGQLIADGTPSAVIEHYMADSYNSSLKSKLDNLEDKATGVVRADKTVRLLSARVVDADGVPNLNVATNESLFMHLDVRLFEKIQNLRCMVFFKDSESKTFMVSQSVDSGELLSDFAPGDYTLTCEIPGSLFGTMAVNVEVQVYNPKIEHLIYEDLFTIRTSYTPNELTSYGPYDDAFFRPTLLWKATRVT
jgi:lipopolysaccharide transport system ATP-binding protein